MTMTMAHGVKNKKDQVSYPGMGPNSGPPGPGGPGPAGGPAPMRAATIVNADTDDDDAGDE
jgi:hypothetical protein